MAEENKNITEFKSISNFIYDMDSIEDSKQITHYYEDNYATEQQKYRDIKITELLTNYVDSYKNKVESNQIYKRYLFYGSIVIIGVLTLVFVFFIGKIVICDNLNSIYSITQLVSLCITFIGLVIGILRIITSYVFPKNEEEYITRIVEIIQQNDLENKKENIKATNK